MYAVESSSCKRSTMSGKYQSNLSAAAGPTSSRKKDTRLGQVTAAAEGGANLNGLLQPEEDGGDAQEDLPPHACP